MGIPYLNDYAWSSWTRDERFFCSVLYGHAAHDPHAFAEWLIAAAGIDASPSGDWDLGYEVAFYRDYLWHRPGGSARQTGLPAKRTFDLCLFGERDIIVIEAKVCEAFDGAQNEDFGRDKVRLKGLPGLEHVEPHVVALASSKYFANAAKHGRPETLSVFDGAITWADLAARYPDRLLSQADEMYGLGPGELVSRSVAQANYPNS